jgi:hypothetical protein
MNVQVPDVSTVKAVTCQTSALYSRMARSDENRPQRATFKMDVRDQRSVSR